jgi:hypothetical protein
MLLDREDGVLLLELCHMGLTPYQRRFPPLADYPSAEVRQALRALCVLVKEQREWEPVLTGVHVSAGVPTCVDRLSELLCSRYGLCWMIVGDNRPLERMPLSEGKSCWRTSIKGRVTVDDLLSK